ncbi:MAG: SgcJ/EcaC family oxidoreductase [Gemmatimonadaceae bacterium]
MTLAAGLFLGLLGPRLRAQTAADTAAIRGVVEDEITAWDQGDATAYSRHVAADATFTNIRGQFFTGQAAFLHQHAAIFESIFKHTTLQQDIVALRFLGPDVAVVEVLTAVTGVTQRRPGMTFDQHGRLRTRLLQVLARQAGEWKIVAYHNVDVKPGVPLPDPR